ncbi:unnamed protein product [Candida verbasci]|uniref:J domain-containing protein n=1 Tax=Candida verbasci TaxID=1227364 RepID=A0A9W4TZI6_9ASCO|nr:unnamed protein product [Candida verbasci]
MSYTKEQETIVLKVLSYKQHQFYEILQVSKTSNDSEIKKSYRKLAIKCHPDKNSHPRSAEAFKIVNKAWEVLSDPDKKRIFDQTGTDPTSRFSGVSNGGASGVDPFNRFANSGGTRYRTTANASPFEEDLFNMFFGGGGASPFSTGPTFTFGNNGFTFQSFGGGQDPFMRQRRTARSRNARNQSSHSHSSSSSTTQNTPEPNIFETLKGLVPILLLLIVPILSAIFGDSPPDYSFVKTRDYNIKRTTPNYKIPFYVNDSFNKKYSNKSIKQLRNYDSKVENLYIQDKRTRCQREQLHKDQLIEDAHGWFTIDYDKLKQAEQLPMPNCDVLQSLNLI